MLGTTADYSRSGLKPHPKCGNLRPFRGQITGVFVRMERIFVVTSEMAKTWVFRGGLRHHLHWWQGLTAQFHSRTGRRESQPDIYKDL